MISGSNGTSAAGSPAVYHQILTWLAILVAALLVATITGKFSQFRERAQLWSSSLERVQVADRQLASVKGLDRRVRHGVDERAYIKMQFYGC